VMSGTMVGKKINSTRFLLALLVAGTAPLADAAASDLGQGIAAYNARNYKAAIPHLQAARDVSKLSDYTDYYLGYAQLLTGDIDGALSTLNAYRANPITSSPLAGKIDVIYGRALLDKRDPQSTSKALNILQTEYKLLPQPDGDFALGLAYEAQSEQQQAALSYQRVYYSWPNTDLAAQSATALDRLRLALGKDFPGAPAAQQLERAEKWLAVKNYAKARAEYVALTDRLSGPEQATAKVGVGVSDYLAGETAAAMRYLKALHVDRSETDAERLYYIEEGARKQDDDALTMDTVRELGEHYPKSVWRMKALVNAGNRYLATNDREKYEPLFKAAYETFPADSSTAYCHWRVTWDAYLGDKPERVTLLRGQVEDYPDDSRAGTALYFLGRIAEADGKPAAARAYYERLTAQFPHYFYAVLGRERTRDKVAAATADPDVKTWLDDVDWPEHRDLSSTEPNDATKLRIERASLLREAALPDVADAEMKFGMASGTEQPQLLALELAQSADSPFRALRIMKSVSGDYLALPLENAPIRFWQMLFPLPYKDQVVEGAKARGLDPFFVAALIRQESEFNPGARSRANALGLMQLEPSTGRMVGRQQGMGAVPASLLFDPAVSIRLGTQYLRGQLDSWDGDLYRTLAAYNAGPGRVHQWLKWADYRDPVEFLESIPFTETREYVQAVLRNADMYRELYSGKHDQELAAPRKDLPPVKIADLVQPRTGSGKLTDVASTPAVRKNGSKTTLVANHRSAAKTVGAKKSAPKTVASTKKPASSKKRVPAGLTEAVIVTR
jgi:soluble lytic murein transglycosylase